MGKQKLLLLPGLDGTGQLFEPLLNALQNETKIEAQVIRYPVNETKTYQELIDFAGDIVQQHRSVNIIAESFSGPIGLKLFEKYPDRIKGLVLVASFITPPRKIWLKLMKFLPIESLLKIDIPNFLIRRYCLGDSASSELILQFKSALKSVSPKVIAHRLSELLKLDKEQFSQINSNKIDYIKALDDKLVPRSCTDELLRVISAELIVVKGPHFLLQTKPEECVEIIIKSSNSKQVLGGAPNLDKLPTSYG